MWGGYTTASASRTLRTPICATCYAAYMHMHTGSAAISSSMEPTHDLTRSPANKGRRYPAEVLTPAEVQALLDVCSLKPHTELRNRAFLAVLYRTGVRCSEALALEPKDVDFFGSSVRVLHGKGDRARTVGIDQGALDMIKEWCVERERRGFTADQSLFCTQTGKAMSGSYVR